MLSPFYLRGAKRLLINLIIVNLNVKLGSGDGAVVRALTVLLPLQLRGLFSLHKKPKLYIIIIIIIIIVIIIIIIIIIIIRCKK